MKWLIVSGVGLYAGVQSQRSLFFEPFFDIYFEALIDAVTLLNKTSKNFYNL